MIVCAAVLIIYSTYRDRIYKIGAYSKILLRHSTYYNFLIGSMDPTGLVQIQADPL